VTSIAVMLPPLFDMLSALMEGLLGRLRFQPKTAQLSLVCAIDVDQLFLCRSGLKHCVDMPHRCIEAASLPPKIMKRLTSHLLVFTTLPSSKALWPFQATAGMPYP
jgi:hypothetical protein